MKERVFLGAVIPKEYGSLGYDMVTLGVLIEEIGRSCSSVRSLLTVYGMVSIAILRWDTKEQKDFGLPKLANGEVVSAFALSEPDSYKER